MNLLNSFSPFSQLKCARRQPLYSSSTLSLAGWGVGSTVYKQMPGLTRVKVTRYVLQHTPNLSVSACVTGRRVSIDKTSWLKCQNKAIVSEYWSKTCNIRFEKKKRKKEKGYQYGGSVTNNICGSYDNLWFKKREDSRQPNISPLSSKW